MEAKKLDETIQTFENYVQEMGETTQQYKDLIDCKAEIKKTVTDIETQIKALNKIETRLNTHITQGKQNTMYLEQWKDKMVNLQETTGQVQLQLNENNKHVEDVKVQLVEAIQQLNQIVPQQIKPILEETQKNIEKEMDELQVRLKEQTENGLTQLEQRITQFINMQIELNKGITSNIQGLEKVVETKMEQVRSQQEKQEETIKNNKAAIDKKLEAIHKMLWVGICGTGVIVVLVGIILFS